jgi:hypothetical protein
MDPYGINRKLDLVLELLCGQAKVLAQIAAEVLGGNDFELKIALAELRKSREALAAAVAAQDTPLQTRSTNMSTGNPTVDTTIAEIQAATTVIDSATIFANSVPGLISDAVSKALANGATAAQLAPLTDLGTALKAKADALAAAVVANTPAAPPPPPAAAPAQAKRKP